VEGHASPIGTPRFNAALSHHRARNIVRYLRSYLGVTFNVWPGHIVVVAYGEFLATDAGATADDPAWRRVDVYLNQDHRLRLATGAAP
jgi:outer membrane protein OmpA-like peptidoglycan-associated protein